jgi:hypothetical protein
MERFVSISALTIIVAFMGQSAMAQAPDFKFHYIEKDADWITSAQQTTLSDIDNDGDLDFTTGNVHQNPSLFWYEYINADRWVKHVIGSDERILNINLTQNPG